MPSLLSDFDELCITQRDAFLQTVPFMKNEHKKLLVSSPVCKSPTA